MRAFTPREMSRVYQVTRSGFFSGGTVLIAIGLWYIASPIVYHINNPLISLGIFPMYIGGMLVILAVAMKKDWFTNARRYW